MVPVTSYRPIQPQQQQNMVYPPTPPSSGDGFSPRPQAPPLLSKTNIYFQGLGKEYRDDDLQKLCSPYGPILRARAVQNPYTQDCKGIGFVEFVRAEDAQRCLQEVVTSGMQARMADERAFRFPYHGQGYQPRFRPGNWNGPNGNFPRPNWNNMPFPNVFIGRVPLTWKEDRLRKLVSEYGNVVSCHLVIKGFGGGNNGFVRMQTKEENDRLIHMLHGIVPEPNYPPLIVQYANNGFTVRPFGHSPEGFRPFPGFRPERMIHRSPYPRQTSENSPPQSYPAPNYFMGMQYGMGDGYHQLYPHMPLIYPSQHPMGLVVPNLSPPIYPDPVAQFQSYLQAQDLAHQFAQLEVGSPTNGMAPTQASPFTFPAPMVTPQQMAYQAAAAHQVLTAAHTGHLQASQAVDGNGKSGSYNAQSEDFPPLPSA